MLFNVGTFYEAANSKVFLPMPTISDLLSQLLCALKTPKPLILLHPSFNYEFLGFGSALAR